MAVALEISYIMRTTLWNTTSLSDMEYSNENQFFAARFSKKRDYSSKLLLFYWFNMQYVPLGVPVSMFLLCSFIIRLFFFMFHEIKYIFN